MLSPSYPPGLQCGDKVVLFDGECKLCHAWARFLIAFDKQRVFKLASVQSAAGKAILQWYGLPTHYYETMLVVDDTVMYQKSSAFIQVMLGLPWPWRLASWQWRRAARTFSFPREFPNFSELGAESLVH